MTPNPEYIALMFTLSLLFCSAAAFQLGRVSARKRDKITVTITARPTQRPAVDE